MSDRYDLLQHIDEYLSVQRYLVYSPWSCSKSPSVRMLLRKLLCRSCESRDKRRRSPTLIWSHYPQMKTTPIKVVAIKRGPVLWPSNLEPHDSYYEMTYYLRLRVGASTLVLEGVAVGGWELCVNSRWNGNIYRDPCDEDGLTASPQVLRVVDTDGSFDNSYSRTEHVEFACLAPIPVGEPSVDWSALAWVRHDMVPEWNEAAEELIAFDEEIVLGTLSRNTTPDVQSLAARRAVLVAACTAARVAVEDKLVEALEARIPEIPEPDPIHWWHDLEKSGSQPIAHVPLLVGDSNGTCLIVWQFRQKPVAELNRTVAERVANELLSYRCIAYPDHASVRKALREAMNSDPTEQDINKVWAIVQELHELWQDDSSED